MRKQLPILSIIFTLSVIACICFSATTLVNAQGNWTVKSLYTTSVEGNETVYTCTDSGSAVVEYTGSDMKSYNTFEADIKYSTAFAHDAQVAIQINTASSYYLFDIYQNVPEHPLSRVLYGNSVLISNDLTSGKWGSISSEEWIHLKFILQKDFIAGYINGVMAYSAASTADEELWTRALICSWKNANQVKNLKLSYTNVEGIQVEGQWIPDGNWSESVTDGITTYYTKEYSSVINYSGKINNINTFEAEVNYVQAFSGEGFTALQINTSGGYYLLDVAPNKPEDPVARVRKNDQILIRQVLTDTGFGNTSSGQWIKLKFILEDNYVIGYINDKLLFKSFDTRGEQLWTRALVCTWWNECYVRNIKLYHTEKDYEAVGYVDLEFGSEFAVSGFGVEKGTLNYQNGTLNATLEDGGAITSPFIEETRGQRYSALLTMQNTLLVRMKNSGGYNKVKISYITSADGNWSEGKSKEFDINGSSDYQPYYFNLSDTDGMNGYLRQFRMEFFGGSGEIVIDAITFERENPIYDYAGEITSCRASVDDLSVTVKGKIKDATPGKKVIIWESSTQNYAESLDFKGLEPLATCIVRSDGTFEGQFPLMKGNTKRLGFLFLASIDGVKVSESFRIENYQDFSQPVQRFSIKGVTVNVTDFGAKGDSYTDDTEAIQSAIDYVGGLGGGTVVLKGDTSIPYGKRYIATHLKLASNIEFRIEKGAVLWQSSRESDYNYKPTYGHDVDINGLMWCHAGAVVNYPLLFIKEKQNVRITGEGTIRMTDIGAEQPDAEYFNGNPTLNVGCTSRIHILPICVYNSDHIDITNVTIARSNIWHMYMSFNDDLYVANILEKEVGCATSDGFTVTSNKNVIIDRVMTYTSDDAIGICTCYDDPRGFLFRPCRPGEDNANENIIIRNSYFWGGFGFSFIPWGSGSPNSELQEIRNVEIYDCVSGGHKSIGCWTDDPFYGTSKNHTYDNNEKDDHTPVKDIYLHNNIFLNSVEFYLGNTILKATNLIVEDCNVPVNASSSKFLLEDFDKDIRSGEGFSDESNFVVGLSYWSNSVGTGGAVGTAVCQQEYGYSGYIKGEGELYQGLYQTSGYYKLSFKTKLISGEGCVFVRDAITKEIIAKKPLQATNNFIDYSLQFNLKKAGTYHFGVMHSGNKDDIVWLDNANITRLGSVQAENYFTEDFEEDLYNITFDGNVSGIEFSDNNSYLSMNPYGDKVNAQINSNATSFDMQFQINVVRVLSNQTPVLIIGNGNQAVKLNLADCSAGWNTVVLKCMDNKLQVYLGGTLSATQSLSLDNGKINLTAVGAVIRLDNVVMTEAGKITAEKTNDDTAEEVDENSTDNTNYSNNAVCKTGQYTQKTSGKTTYNAGCNSSVKSSIFTILPLVFGLIMIMRRRVASLINK